METVTVTVIVTAAVTAVVETAVVGIVIAAVTVTATATVTVTAAVTAVVVIVTAVVVIVTAFGTAVGTATTKRTANAMTETEAEGTETETWTETETENPPAATPWVRATPTSLAHWWSGMRSRWGAPSAAEAEAVAGGKARSDQIRSGGVAIYKMDCVHLIASFAGVGGCIPASALLLSFLCVQLIFCF